MAERCENYDTNYIKKKDTNKNCLEFHFLQKSQWAHISIPPQSGGRGLQRLPYLKYWNGKINLL